MLKKVVLAAVLTLLMASMADAITLVSIKGDSVNMRSGPGENYSVLWELGKGFPLKVLGKKGNWTKIEDFEGDVGWVYGKLLGRKAHMIVKKKRINVRSGPGSSYRLVGKANYGVVFKTIKNDKGWVKVKHENGLTGWIKRSLLWGW
jgi:SH3-like domain-containing protein